jgi:hypothetical protein
MSHPGLSEPKSIRLNLLADVFLRLGKGLEGRPARQSAGHGNPGSGATSGAIQLRFASSEASVSFR